MKRTGERGESKFARITWDEALDTVSRELHRVRSAYGNSSILLLHGGGSMTALNGATAVERLLSKFGGYTRTWGVASYEGALYASMASYGTMTTGSARDDLLNSRLIIMWGWNPAETIWDTGTGNWLARAKEKGIRIVSVDPRCTRSTAVFADEWIPVRPATDTAVLMAMAYVMIQENIYNRGFIDTYTVGFDKFRDHVCGVDDGIMKTPQWAEQISGVPATTITRLARVYAATKPAALIPGWGPARGTVGEQFSRAAIAVIAMAGNIGVSGGFAGGFMRAFHSREMGMRRGIGNPVEKGAPVLANSLYRLRGAGKPCGVRIHRAKIWDAVLEGKAGGYPCDPKLAYVVATNILNSHPDTNKGIKAFKKLDFVVIHEQRMTPTARFADILLPVGTHLEREDIIPPWLGSPYYIYCNRALKPGLETRSDRDICAELAPRLGITDYREGKTDAGWLRDIASATGDIPDFDRFKKDGVVKLKVNEPFVAFRPQVENPADNPFPTLSGKIEIYCGHMAEWKNERLPPIPKYLPAPEGPESPLRNKYPLQLLTTHYLTAAHSCYEKLPWLDEVAPRGLMINARDASARGIRNGDEVLVVNDRGKVRTRAQVTERIMPGIVDLPQGAWFEIDENGIDRGGCANILTPGGHSPAGAWGCNTVLVEVSKT
jgi:anaerobic dimethyl sulfoxide reductase subunit A